ncbi:MAG: hypothetical protein ACSHYF_07655 [Verrucomicrobiaceae bacterium]
MRVPVLFLLSSLLLPAGEPSEVALKVLQAARDGKVRAGSLEELAISPFCGPGKREMIGERWQNVWSWAKAEEAIFVAGQEKVDGDLAGVIVAGRGESGPDGMRIFALGLKREKGEWKVAPVEGSFENVGLGFDDEVRERARVLERWMARERVSGGAKFREKELERYRESLEGLVDAETLKSATPEEVMKRFLAAARERKTNELLVWQGILERTMQDDRDWERMIRSTEVGMADRDRQRAWRLLTDPAVLQVEVEVLKDQDSASVLMGFISNFETGLDSEENRVLRFTLKNGGAGWRVVVPTFFTYSDEDASTHFTAHREEFNWRDEEKSAELATIFEKKHAALRAESPEALMTALAKHLEKGSLREALRYLIRDENPVVEVDEDDEEPDEEALQAAADAGEARMTRYHQATRWWAHLYGKADSIRAAVTKHHVKDGVALGLMRVERPGDWEAGFESVWMEKQGDGWAFVPDKSHFKKGERAAKYAEVVQELTRTFFEDEKELKKSYVSEVMKEVATFDSTAEAPSENEAVEAAKGWRELLGEGDVRMLLKGSGVFAAPEKGTKLLRDLTSSMRGVKAAVEKDELLATKKEGRFQGVSMMVDAGRGLEMHCPLLIVAETKEGPRVMIDVELWLPTNRGKRMRNAFTLVELKKNLAGEDYEAIKKLFAWHEEVADPVWEAWDKEREEKDQ